MTSLRHDLLWSQETALLFQAMHISVGKVWTRRTAPVGRATILSTLQFVGCQDVVWALLVEGVLVAQISHTLY